MLDRTNFRRVVAASAVVTTATQTVTATIALRKGRRDYADGVWGPGLAGIAITSAVVGTGDARRRWALAAVVTGWAIRLERQMLSRFRRSDTEDPRYTEYLKGDSTAAVLAKVFLTQGVSQLLVAAPIEVAAASPLPRGVRRLLFPLGIATMITGAVVEATADAQKTHYTQLGDNKPDVLETGLWGWSRHPNYFGDSVVWDGAWLTAAASSPAGWTLPAPALMNYLLIFATGAKRTERGMQDRPGYRDYQRTVSFFFPRPKKKSD